MGPVVSGSVICSNGELTPNFEYIAKLREQSATIPGDFNSEKKVKIYISLYFFNSDFTRTCFSEFANEKKIMVIIEYYTIIQCILKML